MRTGACLSLFSFCFVSCGAIAQEREVSLDREDASLPSALAGLRISGFFVGSANYNSHIQMVPEFAGNAPVSSEPRRIDYRFDQFSLGVNKVFAPWLFAGASIEIERHGHRHSHGFDPDFGCPGTGQCIEQFGTESIDTEVSLHRFNLTAVAPLGNGLALSFGRFDTPFGYERHDAALNLTATTSELQRFGRPQSMTGLQAAYQFAPWLGVSFRYGAFRDADGARTGVAQTLQSFTFASIFHLSELVPDLRPLGVTYARTRHHLDWVDLRLEYRLGHSNRPVFADVEPGIPITEASHTGHVVTAQLVVNY